MIEYLFKNGCTHALTLSFDDGYYDEKLIKILNRYDIKGTFCLNSLNLQGINDCGIERIGEVYSGHEVASHGAAHRVLNYLPVTEIYEEIYCDRKRLEQQVDYPVVGHSYACNGYSGEVIAALRTMGILYARTTENTGAYKLPDDFMLWKPTCHYKNALKYADGFLNSISGWLGYPRLFFVWGHAHELEKNGDWKMWEEFCEKVGKNSAVWYADNYSIFRYVTALRSLVVTADRTAVFNPSGIPVWVSCGDKKYMIPPNGSVRVENGL